MQVYNLISGNRFRKFMAMKEIIGSILEIEKKANRILSEAYEEKKKMDEVFADDLERMKKDIDKSVIIKLQKIEDIEKAEAEERISMINKAANDKLSSMDVIYKKNRDYWIDTVFKSIIGR